MYIPFLNVPFLFYVIYSLKAVIDRPPIEDREFAPLSELQGFKLLPGAVSLFIDSNFYSASPIKFLKEDTPKMWAPQ